VIDLAASSALLFLAALVAVAFAWGPARDAVNARVEDDGGSRLLGKPAMRAVYWFLAPVAQALVKAGVPANAVTLTSVVFALLAGALFAVGHFGLAAAAATCAGLCDLLDGVVARAAGTASDAGEVFDAAADRYGEFFVLAGILVHARASLPYMGCALAALLGSMMVSYASAKAEAEGVPVPRGVMRRPERAAYLVLGAALVPWSELAVRRGWLPSLAAEAPLILALVFIGVLANVSALLRFAAIARALVTPEAARAFREHRRSITRHQIAALVAGVIDFGTMAALVESHTTTPVPATLVGALVGASVNFALGRRWAFGAWREGPAPQALRYAVVSLASATLNAVGVHLLHDGLHVQYVAARAVVAVLVSLLWNYPMQRGFVFRRARAPSPR
jgi:CDP-diacylglycerol--glycerol-3-phosphate 3-phosphatidyltransferase